MERSELKAGLKTATRIGLGGLMLVSTVACQVSKEAVASGRAESKNSKNEITVDLEGTYLTYLHKGVLDDGTFLVTTDLLGEEGQRAIGRAIRHMAEKGCRVLEVGPDSYGHTVRVSQPDECRSRLR